MDSINLQNIKQFFQIQTIINLLKNSLESNKILTSISVVVVLLIVLRPLFLLIKKLLSKLFKKDKSSRIYKKISDSSCSFCSSSKSSLLKLQSNHSKLKLKSSSSSSSEKPKPKSFHKIRVNKNDKNNKNTDSVKLSKRKVKRTLRKFDLN